MIKPIWSKSPEWASYFVELEGGRVFWSISPYTELEITPEFKDSGLWPDGDDFYKLRVVQCSPRPKWKTLIHFKWDGVVVTYEAEGKLTHSAVKRQLMDEMGVDASIRVMLEYIEIV